LPKDRALRLRASRSRRGCVASAHIGPSRSSLSSPGQYGASIALLPPFDEFLIGYRDRGASLDPAYAGRVVPGGNGIFNPIVVTGGRVTGTWRRTLKKDNVTLSFSPFTEWSAAEREAIAAAAECYGGFQERVPILEW
jgi:hypothetical protein